MIKLMKIDAKRHIMLVKRFIEFFHKWKKFSALIINFQKALWKRNFLRLSKRR